MAPFVDIWHSTESSHNPSFARYIDTFTCAPLLHLALTRTYNFVLFSAMPHFQKRAVIADPRWRNGYVLIRRRVTRRIPCPAGGAFLVEYDVCRHLSAAMRKRTGRQFAAPLALRPERDANGRYDLSMTLADGGGGKVHTKYHRVVGLSLLRAAVSRTGRALAAPQFVVPAHVGDFEVDHKDRDPLDCRVCNLVLSPSCLHRSAGRFGWERRSLPHAVRARPRTQRARKQRVARRPAAWR